MTGFAAATFAALGAALVVGGRPDPLSRLRRSSELTIGRHVVLAAQALKDVPRWACVAAAAVAAAIIGAAAAGAGGSIVAAVAAAAVAVGFVRHRGRRAMQRRASDVVDGCLALASELGSGSPAGQALSVVAKDWPDLFSLASRQVAIGGEPARALRHAAERPGAEALVAVAAAWEVSERTGARLSAVLTAVADSLRAEAAVRREADAQLASVRATSRLMALLPVATLATFSVGDTSAARFLTEMPYGVACAVMAGGFIAAGVFWVDRTARSVRSPWAR